MSGGGSTSRYGWESGPTDTCNLRFKTVLNSPVTAVIAKLSPKDVLDVEVIWSDTRQVVGVVHPLHGFAGVITAMEAAQLLKCLTEGHRYIAVVISVETPSCRIEVRNSE